MARLEGWQTLYPYFMSAIDLFWRLHPAEHSPAGSCGSAQLAALVLRQRDVADSMKGILDTQPCYAHDPQVLWCPYGDMAAGVCRNWLRGPLGGESGPAWRKDKLLLRLLQSD